MCVCVCARVRVCEHPSFKSENSDKSISLAEPNFWHMQASVNNIKDRKFSDLGIADRVEAVRESLKQKGNSPFSSRAT